MDRSRRKPRRRKRGPVVLGVRDDRHGSFAILPKVALVDAKPGRRHGLNVRRPKRARPALVTAYKLRQARGPKDVPWRVLRSKWVVCGAIHECVSCRQEIAIGDSALHQVVTGPGEFISQYEHWLCSDGKNATKWDTPQEETEETFADGFRDGWEDGGGEEDIPF